MKKLDETTLYQNPAPLLVSLIAIALITCPRSRRKH